MQIACPSSRSVGAADLPRPVASALPVILHREAHTYGACHAARFGSARTSVWIAAAFVTVASHRRALRQSGKRSRTVVLKACGVAPTSPDPAAVKFQVQEIPDKGVGVIATEKISKGELVWQESPLLVFNTELDTQQFDTWENQILAALQSCNDEQRPRFWELADVHSEFAGEKTATGIMKTNGLPIEDGSGVDKVGVYGTVSRFNHSCNHNVNNSWQPEKGKGMECLHATRDIEPGEELCITYIDLFLTYAARQQELQRIFKFQCSCEACNACDELRDKSDLRRYRLSQLREALPQSQTLIGKVVVKMAEIIDEELYGNPPAKCCVYHMGYEVAAAGGDLESAQLMAQNAWQCSVIAEGADSWRSEFLKSVADNPGSGIANSQLKWGDSGMS